MIGYYTSNHDNVGAVGPQNSDKSAKEVQWYESGIFWDALMNYAKITKDHQYTTVVSNALSQASYGDAQSFLGTSAMQKLFETIGGKWNDDLNWWALATLTGAELYGMKQTLVSTSAATYGGITENTFNQVQSDWDASCGGGIWWSRDRSNPKTKDYKSVITNAQQMMIATRLYGLTKNGTYLELAKQNYQWMKSIGLITSAWHVLDGVTYSPNGCVLSEKEFSYSYGVLVGSLALLSKYTNDPSYASDASNILDFSLSLFTVNNVFTDPCESNNSCPVNSVSFKGSYIEGLTIYYQNTDDESVKAKIQKVVDASALSLVQNSCDANWGCYNTWQGQYAKIQTDFHSELNTFNLMNAVAAVHSSTNIQGAKAAPAYGGKTRSTASITTSDAQSFNNGLTASVILVVSLMTLAF